MHNQYLFLTNAPFKFVAENEDLRATIAEVSLKSLEDALFEFERIPVRTIEIRDNAFEVAWVPRLGWAKYTGNGYRQTPR